MSAPEHRLDLEIVVGGSLGAPVATMKVVGEFDRLQVVRFDEAVTTLPDALTRLTVDLTETTIIDSAGLGSLIRLRHSLDRVDAELCVVVSRPFQVTVMRIGGLVDFLGVNEV